MSQKDVSRETRLSRYFTLLEAGWLLLATLLPLWVHFGARQPFELPKVVLLRTLAGLLAAVGLLLFSRAPIFSLRHSPVFWPIVALSGALILATVTAVDPQLSFWGSYERGQGLLTQLSYLLLFLLVATGLHTLMQARRLLTALLLPAAVLVLLGIAQALGWQPLPLLSDARSPVYATLGRSNFLGAYLALLLPLTLALLLTTASRWQQIALSALFLGQLTVLGMSLARSAWLAALVGLCLFALLLWGTHLRTRWRRAAWSGLGLLASGAPLTVIWLANAERGSTAARLAIWQAVLELIRQRPFFGYGPDSLFLVFPRIFPPQLVYYQGRQVFVDRAHNWLLDWSVTAGVLGLLALLALLATVFLLAQSSLREAITPQKHALLAGATAALGANLTNNLTSFDVTATAASSWLLMGLVVAIAALPSPTAATPLRPRSDSVTEPAHPRPYWQSIIIVLLALLLSGGTLLANARILLADVAARRADQHALAGDWQQAAIGSERAIAYWPLEPSYYHDLGSHRWQQARLEAQPPWPRLQQAEIALLTATTLRPRAVGSWAELAEFYAAAASEFGADTGPVAHQAFRQAAALAPNHATVYVAWGRLSLQEADMRQAAFLLRQAVRLDASHGLAFLLLAEAELGLGRVHVAIADYREALRLQPASSIAYTGLARSYWEAGWVDAAQSSLAHALELDPHNADALALAQQIQFDLMSNGGEP